MQLPILKGIYATSEADWKSSFPVNYEPVLKDTGLSQGYLRTAPGIADVVAGPGRDRGAILWNGTHYRVMGSQLLSVLGASTTWLGAITGTAPVALDYGFDYLGIVTPGAFYLYNGAVLTQVTDPDLGAPIDMLWADGYYVLTDGDYLLVTELNDPFSIDPLKYGSSEEDPDPITGLMKVRGEVYALNRYTIENFQNVGGSGFPFTRNAGGLIPKGCVGRGAKAYISETFAFVGGGRNEAVSVYLAGAGQAVAIATAEVDAELAQLTSDELAAVRIETRTDQQEERLYVHLPTKTLVWYRKASEAAKEMVWTVLAGGSDMASAYPLANFCCVDGVWIGGSPTGRIGRLDESINTHFGEIAGARFDTLMIYNESRGGIIKALELVGLPGRAPFGVNPTVFLSMTLDGQSWGEERAKSTGTAGDTSKRVQWRPKRRFRNYVGLRFRSANTAVASWNRLEADIEGLSG